MANHHIHVSDLAPHAGAATLEVAGDEAHHAVRVKRLVVGDPVTVMDGKGRTLEGPISAIDKDRRTNEWKLSVDAGAGILLHSKPERPLHVYAPAPKGDRLDEMIDGLSQVGAVGWRHLHTARTVADPKPTKLDRLERIAFEAMKQCGRVWTLEIGPASALNSLRLGASTIVADASGAPFSAAKVPITGPLSLVIGPEGGLSPEELDRLRQGGCTIARFGPHILRIETAAVVAASHLVV